MTVHLATIKSKRKTGGEEPAAGLLGLSLQVGWALSGPEKRSRLRSGFESLSHRRFECQTVFHFAGNKTGRALQADGR